MIAHCPSLLFTVLARVADALLPALLCTESPSYTDSAARDLVPMTLAARLSLRIECEGDVKGGESGGSATSTSTRICRFVAPRMIL
jgi:hypothetical protein